MFNKICGNEFAKELLTSMIKNQRLVHTVILCGEAGLGKLTFAREIAKQVVGNGNFEKSVENSVDINVTDGGFSEIISINNIREIRNRINIAPHESDKKVEIIANCDKMTVAAQNALLKSLEEPTETTLFILTTSNIDKLLETILSRATVVNIEKVSDQQAIDFLTKHYADVTCNSVDQKDITNLVKMFGGNIGLIKTILDNPQKNYLLECENFLFYIMSNNQYGVMKILSRYQQQNKSELMFFFELFKLYFQKIVKIYFLKDDNENNFEYLNDEVNDVLKNHSCQTLVGLENFLYVPDLINQAIVYFSSNVNFGLTLTWFNLNLFCC